VNFSTLNAVKRSIVPIDFSLFLKSITEKFLLYFSRAAISGISVLAVLALFCCTCYCVVFLSKQIDDDDDDEEQGLSRQGQGRCLTS